MDRQMGEALDRWITGNYGEDSVPDEPERRTVRIPECTEHAGYAAMTVSLDWVCPVCGGPRGEPFQTVSYDGSRRLACDGWENPCGHVDRYADVRAEAALRCCVCGHRVQPGREFVVRKGPDGPYWHGTCGVPERFQGAAR